MNRSFRPLTAPAALALVALVGVGCSDSPATTGHAEGSTNPAVTGTRTQAATGRDQAVRFSECLRNNGVPDFPDPDAKGQYAYGVSVHPAVFQKAVDACKDLEPPGALSADRSPAEQTASLRFARCMRAKGVPDFPDPVRGEPLINTYKIPSSNRPGGMAILDATIAKCRPELDQAAAVGQ